MAISELRPAVSEALSPAEAFTLLGQELRLDILRVLFEADGPVAFSTIAAELGVRDSGHVYYHIDALRPHFVERQEGGYRIRQAGRDALRILRAGTVTDRGDLRPVTLDDDCVRCGGDPELRYSDGFALVGCPDCERWFVRYRFPPGGLEHRSPGEIAAALDARCRSTRRLGNAGVCDPCNGRMDRRLRPGSPDGLDHPATVRYECRDCDRFFDSTVGAAVLAHPAVVAFRYDHGIAERPLWALDVAFDPGMVSEVRDDPPGATLTVPGEGERLRVEVDDRGRVTDTFREPV